MKRVFTALILVLGLVVTSTALAQNTSKKVATLLSGVESEPTEAQWKALGAEGAAELIKVAGDANQTVIKRGRALSALQHFRSPQTSELLRGILKDEEIPNLLKRKALHSLAKTENNKALDAIEPALADDSSRMREAAIKALADIGTEDARKLMKLRLGVEKSDYIRERLRTALAAPVKEPVQFEEQAKPTEAKEEVATSPSSAEIK